MRKVGFYKIGSGGSMAETLAFLASSFLNEDEKCLIVLPTSEMDKMDERLWTFASLEFLPHLSAKSPEFAEYGGEVPIILSDGISADFGASMLISTLPFTPSEASNFKQIFFAFDSKNAPELSASREFWKALKAGLEFEPELFEQNEKLEWQKKA